MEGPRMASAMKEVITPCDSVKGHTLTHDMEGAACYGSRCLAIYFTHAMH